MAARLFRARFDRRLDPNDVGYQRRARLNELEHTATWRQTDVADDASLRSVSWGVEPQLRYDDRGDRLPPTLLLSRSAQTRAFARDSTAQQKAWLDLARQLLESGHRVALATHGEALVRTLLAESPQRCASLQAELEMPLGLGTQLLDTLQQRASRPGTTRSSGRMGGCTC